jgi:hypothetical protein
LEVQNRGRIEKGFEMMEMGFWRGHNGGVLRGTGRGHRSLRKLVAEDEVVAKRGKPSLPKLKFMEGLGPEDPRYDADARAA